MLQALSAAAAVSMALFPQQWTTRRGGQMLPRAAGPAEPCPAQMTQRHACSVCKPGLRWLALAEVSFPQTPQSGSKSCSALP